MTNRDVSIKVLETFVGKEASRFPNRMEKVSRAWRAGRGGNFLR
jgi:hypothetical protein